MQLAEDEDGHLLVDVREPLAGLSAKATLEHRELLNQLEIEISVSLALVLQPAMLASKDVTFVLERVTFVLRELKVDLRGRKLPTKALNLRLQLSSRRRVLGIHIDVIAESDPTSNRFSDSVGFGRACDDRREATRVDPHS